MFISYHGCLKWRQLHLLWWIGERTFSLSPFSVCVCDQAYQLHEEGWVTIVYKEESRLKKINKNYNQYTSGDSSF